MPFLPLALIYEPLERVRASHADVVESLAKSMGRLGLKVPVTVRSAQRTREGQLSDVWEIVAGCHRVAAAKKLGWTEIDATIFEGDETDARLWALAENLHRAELTVQERAEHIAEWIRLTGERIGAGCTNSGKPGPKGAVRAAERELGIEHTEAVRAVRIAKIAPEAKEAAANAGIADNQSALLRVAKEPSPEKQLAAIKRERDLAEAHKQNRQTDRVIALTEAQQFAAWLMERTDLNELPTIISWLEGCKPRDVIAALRREAA